MFKTKRIKDGATIQFVIDGNATIKEFEAFAEMLSKHGENVDFKLIGVIVNFPKQQSLKDVLAIINSEVRMIAGLMQFAILTDAENIKPILLSIDKRLPYLPIKVFELREELTAWEWLGKKFRVYHTK